MRQGDRAENFQCMLVNGNTFDLYQVLEKGPVILNFIMGTWCPFCDNHLKKIRAWQDKMPCQSTLVIISSEPHEKLYEWNRMNPNFYIFASDPKYKLIKLFDVKHIMLSTAKPATFLIDSDGIVKMYFAGVRTDKARDQMIKTIRNIKKLDEE